MWPQVLIPPEGPAVPPQLFPLELQPAGSPTYSALWHPLMCRFSWEAFSNVTYSYCRTNHVVTHCLCQRNPIKWSILRKTNRHSFFFIAFYCVFLFYISNNQQQWTENVLEHFDPKHQLIPELFYCREPVEMFKEESKSLKDDCSNFLSPTLVTLFTKGNSL